MTEIDGRRLGKPNDLIFDGSGNLIFTCPNDGRHEPSGYVCCLTAEGALTTLAEGLYFAMDWPCFRRSARSSPRPTGSAS